MNCLWLTWIDPAPEHDGQRIYSGRLIQAVAQAGGNVEVLCFAHAGSERARGLPGDPLRWSLVPQAFRPAWRSVFSSLPNISYRAGTGAMRQGLAALLKEHHWDAIVLDGLYAGWALGVIGAHYERASNRPCLIYVSHNHEETTRMSVAQNYAGNFIFRTALRQDAWKVARLERRMADQADVVTAITQEDAALFLARQPRKKTIVLPPGYGDRRLASRRIDAATPRRALLVGSFEWLAKQMNLKEFLAVADPLFAAAGLRMQIVGNGEEAFFDSLRRDVVATDIVGPVADVHPYLDQARIAIVPERSGGGFKLKLLEYVFNRVPIAALGNSIAGVPLEPRESVLTFSSYHALAAGVVAAMDDLELLNQLQEQAFLACKDEFDWLQRGEALRAAMGAPLSGASKDMAKAAVSAPLVPVQP